MTTLTAQNNSFSFDQLSDGTYYLITSVNGILSDKSETFTVGTGTPVVENYTVTWKNEDGTVLETDTVALGTIPTYDGIAPVKGTTAQYTYTFKSWDKEVVAVTGNVVYTATFRGTVNKYTITWSVDGKETTAQVEYGTIPTFTGSTDKPADKNNIYTFTGWTPEVVRVGGNATYTAQYEVSANINEVALTRFTNEVAAIASATTREEKYSAISIALNTYNTLTDKSNVVDEYNTLKAAIQEYNAYVDNVNEELTNATDAAVKILGCALSFMIALVGVWIALKKLLSGGKI